jgi:hypothetical protein
VPHGEWVYKFDLERLERLEAFIERHPSVFM